MSKTVCVDDGRMRCDEAEQIRLRREKLEIETDDPHFGLCISGGGIRSATLSLGIIQGLARRGLLPYIDYLSTVSGGGYIGTWLHGVIRNCGGGVPDRILPYLNRPDVEPHTDAEDDPIAFLRKFSSYLASDIGLFSADFWVILIIWMRNFSLNFVILTTALAVAPLALFGGGFFVQWLGAMNSVAVCCPLIACLFCISGAAVIAAKGIGGVRNSFDCDANFKQPERPFDRPVYASIATVLVLAASVGMVCFADKLSIADWQTLEKEWAGPATVLVWLLVLYALIQFAGGYRKWWALILFSTVAAATTTALLYFALRWITQWNDFGPYGFWLQMTLGPPLLMVVWLAGVGLHLGLMGIELHDFSREWLSRFGAFFAITAVAWAALYGLFVFGPFGVALLHDGRWKITLTSAALGWIATTVAGVLAGNSPKTGEKNDPEPNKTLDLLVAVAPTVFLTGFLLALGVGVHAILAGTFGATGYWDALSTTKWLEVSKLLALCASVAAFLQWRVNINEFSMLHFYKNRLVRCYLGASRGSKRTPSMLTGFDPCDDIPIATLRATEGYYGPYAIVNTTLNINRGTELAKQERKGTSFAYAPLYCGFDPPRSVEDPKKIAREQMCEDGFRSTRGYSYEAGPLIGTCMGISGAAANPNWGFHTSAPMAFLLTIFDVRLGWWAGNPRFERDSRRPGPVSALWWLLQELFAQTDARSRYVNLSDGGHYENLGLYELVRRRCRFIIACDGEEDHSLQFEALGGAIRKCRIDFGVDISLNPRPILKKTGWSGVHAAVGTITYPPDKDGVDPCEKLTGHILYLKSSLTGNEPEDVEQYHATHPTFPHETTLNQFFTESQFESYRRLGLHIVEETLGDWSTRSCRGDWHSSLIKAAEANLRHP